MTKVASEIRRRFDVARGINVLRNDDLSALAIALATGASFIPMDKAVVEQDVHRVMLRPAK